MSSEDLYDILTCQRVELALTAHPKELNRRTLLDKHRRIQILLMEADELRNKATKSASLGPTKYKMKLIDEAVQREIGLIWQSDELPQKNPSVQEEAERGTLVIETVLWEALPNFLRKLNANPGLRSKYRNKEGFFFVRNIPSCRFCCCYIC